MCKNDNALCSASEYIKQNLADRTLDLPFSFRLKHITSLKPPVARTKREFAVLVSGQLCSYVCFELAVERILFVCIR